MIYIILILIIKYHNEINSFNKIKHHLNDSILLNNYGIVYLINNMSLLKSKNVKQVKLSEYIKTGTITFII